MASPELADWGWRVIQFSNQSAFGMPQIAAQCTNCGAFTRRSFHYEEEYQSSVLERLRTSNFPATDEEISHVRHTILPTVSDDISSIESKIASLHKVMRSMEEERERLINVQKRYHNLVSLHRTLPSEIWSEIFLYTLSSASDLNAFNASGSIWQLSHVSRRWRSIALSLGSFWSTMDIRFPKVAQQDGDVQRLETIIHRSRERPLDISLSDYRFDGQIPSSNPSILKHLLEIIFAESYRWRKVALPDCRMYWNILEKPLNNQLPHLESLGLVVDPEAYSVVSMFRACPRLRKLTLRGTIPPAIELPWDQITELDLSRVDLDDEGGRRACLRLIGQCPSLEILTMSEWDSADDESAYTAITCSNMRKLYATSVPVIDALTLPRLRDASLSPNDSLIHFDILHSFKRLLIRSNCLGALTRLSLNSVPLAASPEHSLCSILSQTHSLAFLDLAVIVGEFDDETDASDREQIVAMVKSLEVVSTESVTFLPFLSSLDIQVYNHRDSWRLLYLGPVGSFASTVKTRWKGDDTLGLARLKRCRFAVHVVKMNKTICRDSVGVPIVNVFNEEETHIFNALIDEGMDLSIRVTSEFIRPVGGRYPVFAVPPLLT
ncbi:hypothetical protein BDZ89DRAFT_1136671 [Hymenopellis radicata]|nr:hypothetical protein BDZ89DRAFT_1136671 [Hymenopellis radicata]